MIAKKNRYLTLNIQLFADGEIKYKVDLDKKDAESNLSKLGNIGKTVFKSMTIAIGTASTALGGLVLKSSKMAGDLEQNVGGAEAVFGELGDTISKIGTTFTEFDSTTGEFVDNFWTLEEISKKAFGNMGVSASDYLATINKMGSLMQGAGIETEKSLYLSGEAMQRAADVASVMGIDIDSAMESIAGAAKGNFTMMDNLGVAMNATTIEAYALSKGIDKTYDSMTNAEKIEYAMQMFLEKTAKYAGNYAKENETFAGSFTTLKASIENFISGASDVQPVIDSVMQFGNILVKTIGETAPKLVEGIVGLINGVVPQLPTLLQKLLPTVIKGSIDLTQGLVKALPSIIPILMQGIVQAFSGITQILPDLIQALITATIMIIQALAEQMPTLLPQIIDAILQVVPLLMENLPLFIKAGAQLLIGVVQGLIQSIPTLLSKVKDIGLSIINYYKQLPGMMFDIGKNLIQGLWNGIVNVKDWIVGKIKGFGNTVLSTIKGIFGIHSPSKEFAWIGKMNIIGLEEGIENMQPDLEKTIDKVMDWDYDTSGLDFLKTGSFNVSAGYDNKIISSSINQASNYISVNVDMDTNKFGKVFVRDIKTFSGGAKNSYNYGGGQ